MKSIRKEKKEYKKELKTYLDRMTLTSKVPRSIWEEMYRFNKVIRHKKAPNHDKIY